MLKKIFLICIFIWGIQLHSQSSPKIDSLLRVLANYDKQKIQSGNKTNSLGDSVKVKLFNKIALLYKDIKPANTIAYGTKAKDLASRIRFKKGIAYSSMLIGIGYNRMGNYPSAIRNQTNALHYYKELGDLLGVADAHHELGIIFAEMGNFPESMQHSLTALQLYEQHKDYIAVGIEYGNIGILYKQQEKYEEALKSYYKALDIYKKTDPEDQNYYSLYVYNSIGQVFLKQGKYDKSLEVLVATLKKGESFGDAYLDADTNLAIGNNYLALHKYADAQKHNTKALELFTRIQDKSGQANSYINIGYGYHRQGNSTLGIQNIQKGLAIANEIGQMEWMKNAYKNLADIYSSLGNFKLAYDNQVMYKNLAYSLFNTEKDKKFTQFQMTYDFDRKQQLLKEIQQKKDALAKLSTQRQKNTNYIIISILFFVCVLTVGIYYNLKRNQKQKKLIELQKDIVENQNFVISQSLTEKETLLREIHHRVKNNLQIISSLLNIQSQDIKDESVLSSIQQGQNRVQAMSLIHQNLYQSEHINNVNIENYLKELVSYLGTMFNGDSQLISVGIATSDIQFDIDTAIPLGLIVNELVSNAYKYAFDTKEQGQIWITIEALNQVDYKMEVKDNGKGLPPDFDPKTSNSMGLKLVTILSRQLRGGMQTRCSGGITSFIINFKDLKNYHNAVQLH